MENSKYDAAKIKKICGRKLALEFAGKKEQSAWYSLDGRDTVRLTVPHGRKPVRRGLYRFMAQQLKLHHSEFDELLDCSLTREGYDALLRQRVQAT